jgi:periplasmic divalent cation tolerance protein
MADKLEGMGLILVMAGAKREAETIARSLVEEKLAACVNIVRPVRSIYRWRGRVEDAREYMLMFKTRATLYSAVERRVLQLHSYEVPEIIALTPTAGSRRYLDWLVDSANSVSLQAAPRS